MKTGINMEYKRLNFEDYFTICSDNWNQKETDLEMAKYKDVTLKTGTVYLNFRK